MDLLPIKQWIYRTRKKNYGRQIDDYSRKLRSAMDEEIRQKLLEARQKKITIGMAGCVHSKKPDDKDEAKDGSKSILGVTVERTSIPAAKINDEILLIHKDSHKLVARGYILEIDRQRIKIKFARKVWLKKESPSEPKEASDESNAEMVETELAKEEDNQTLDDKLNYLIVYDKKNIFSKRHRLEQALGKLNGVSWSLSIHKSLLGYYSDWTNEKYSRCRVVRLTGLPGPRGDKQLLAITQSLKNRISLIEGVAGSGKTLVAANIACSFARQRGRKVLLCSPIQSTVDRLARMINATEGVKVVQLPPVHSSGLRVRAKYDNCLLDELVKDKVFEFAHEQNRKALVHEDNLNIQGMRQVNVCSDWLRKKFEHKVLSEADVVCCTIEQSGSPKLAKIKFSMLIIDDAQMVTEMDCLVPMMTRGVKQVTLLSDMRRDIRLSRSISPSSDARSVGQASWKSNSTSVESASKKKEHHKVQKKQRSQAEVDYLEPGGLFERWLSMGLAAVAMKIQYRTHQTLAAFPNHHFYMSRLKTDSASNEQMTRHIREKLLVSEENFNWLPKRDCLTAIFDTLATSNSINDTVRDIIGKLVAKEHVQKFRIGVIANIPPYNSSSSLGQSPFDVVDYGMVDEFVGREKDFIILSCSEYANANLNRINPIASSSNDFLKNDTALNIALTRAKLGLFIVADLRNLLEDKGSQSSSRDEHSSLDEYCQSWRRLVKYYRRNELVT